MTDAELIALYRTWTAAADGASVHVPGSLDAEREALGTLARAVPSAPATRLGDALQRWHEAHEGDAPWERCLAATRELEAAAETLGTHPGARAADTGGMFTDLTELLTVRIAGVELTLAVHLVDGRTRWAIGGPRYLWPVRWAAAA